MPLLGSNAQGEAAPGNHSLCIGFTEDSFTKDRSLAGPDEIPVPPAWLEFDVENVERATAELESRGYRMLVKNK
jgi:hypothetical protein